MNARIARHLVCSVPLRDCASFSLGALLLLSSFFLLSCDDGPDADHKDSAAVADKKIDTAGLPVFLGSNAYKLVEKQVSFGPRNPNSSGAKKALAFFVEELKKYTPDVRTQEFAHEGYGGERLNLTNVIASFNPNAGTRVLLCAHWDTRPRADSDHDSARRKEPILGANDAGSGVGVLLELARLLKEVPPAIGVDIVLFDGEDYGDSHIDGIDQYFLGSRYFASHLPPDYRPFCGILLDLVGDIEAKFSKERYSFENAGWVVDIIWQAAAELNLMHFNQRVGDTIQDDHWILNEIAGIPTIDIIDIDLVGHDSINARRRYWHTHKDGMENIGAKPLEEVGRLLVYTVYRVIPARLSQQASTGR